MKQGTALLIVFFSLSVFANDSTESDFRLKDSVHSSDHKKIGRPLSEPQMFPKSELGSKKDIRNKIGRQSSNPENQENTSNERWVCADGDGRIVEGKLGETCADVMANMQKPWTRRDKEDLVHRLPAPAKGPYRCRKEVFDTSSCSP